MRLNHKSLARTGVVFQHNDWERSAIAPRVGLRQGCSASPLLFRWVLQDALADPEARWASDGAGLDVGGQSPLTHLCWADDTWLFAASMRHAAYQVRTLRQEVEPTGLLVRLEKCAWLEYGRKPWQEARTPREERRETRRNGDLDGM